MKGTGRRRWRGLTDHHELEYKYVELLFVPAIFARPGERSPLESKDRSGLHPGEVGDVGR